MPIEQELRIVSSVNHFQGTPELVSIYHDGLKTGFLESYYSFWDHSVHLHVYVQPGVCYPGLLHPSVVMLIQHPVGIHAHCQPLCRFIVESDQAVSHVDFGWEFRQRCFSWPLLHVKSVASGFTVPNWRSRLLAHSMLSVAQAASLVITWFTFSLVATHPRLATQEMPLACTLSSTHFISLAGCSAKRLGDTEKPCGTPASTQ
jgi:hypothetical protein